MNQLPETLNLTVYQGVPWSDDITLLESLEPAVPVDLTGYSAEAQVRQRPDSPDVLATMTITFASDRTTGVLTAALSSAQTAAIPTRNHAYYDIRLTKEGDDSATIVPLAGTITALHAITRHQEP